MSLEAIILGVILYVPLAVMSTAAVFVAALRRDRSPGRRH